MCPYQRPVSPFCERQGPTVRPLPFAIGTWTYLVAFVFVVLAAFVFDIVFELEFEFAVVFDIEFVEVFDIELVFDAVAADASPSGAIVSLNLNLPAAGSSSSTTAGFTALRLESMVILPVTPAKSFVELIASLSFAGSVLPARLIASARTFAASYARAASESGSTPNFALKALTKFWISGAGFRPVVVRNYRSY